MSFGLTTVRVGAFARLSREASTALKQAFSSSEPLSDLLCRISQSILHSERYARAISQLIDTDKLTEWKCADVAPLRDDVSHRVETGVARLPDAAFSWSSDSGSAQVRIHASFTTCAMSPSFQPEFRGVTKLWWNFEIIPSNAGETVSANLLSAIEPLASAGMTGLIRAYNEAIVECFPNLSLGGGPVELGPERIVVCIADNDSQSIAQLLNRIVVSKKAVSEIRQSQENEPNQGIADLQGLMGSVSKEGVGEVGDAQISVNLQVPNVVGLLCALRSESIVRIAGFTRRQGFSVNPSRLPQSAIDRMRGEAYRRAFSGARVLSAHLADDEASRMDQTVLAR